MKSYFKIKELLKTLKQKYKEEKKSIEDEIIKISAINSPFLNTRKVSSMQKKRRVLKDTYLKEKQKMIEDEIWEYIKHSLKVISSGGSKDIYPNLKNIVSQFVHKKQKSITLLEYTYSLNVWSNEDKKTTITRENGKKTINYNNDPIKKTWEAFIIELNKVLSYYSWDKKLSIVLDESKVYEEDGSPISDIQSYSGTVYLNIIVK